MFILLCSTGRWKHHDHRVSPSRARPSSVTGPASQHPNPGLINFYEVWTTMLPHPLSGYMVVPAGGGGTLLGSYIIKRLKLRCRGIIRFCMVCAIISLLAIFIFLLHCPDVPMAGVTAPYQSGLTGEPTLDQYKYVTDFSSQLPHINR